MSHSAILSNVSANSYLLLGIPLEPGDVLNVSSEDIGELTIEPGIETAILAGDILVNDGTVTFTPQAGWNYLIGFNAQLATAPSMLWHGNWTPGEYIAGSALLDGAWGMVANTTTSDRPAPQPDGDPVDVLQATPVWLNQINTSTVRVSHTYTFAEAGWFKSVRIWVAEIGSNIEHYLYFVNRTDPLNIIVSKEVLPALVVGWNTVAIGNKIARVGDIYQIIYDSVNTSADTIVTGGWGSIKRGNNVTPATGEWTTNQNRTVLRINKTDDVAGNRSAELLGSIPDTDWTMVQVSDSSRSQEFLQLSVPVDQGAYVEFDVIEIAQGSGGRVQDNQPTTVTGLIPVAQPTKYVENLAYWNQPANVPIYITSVVSALEFDGVDQAVTTSVFGLDFNFQPALVSVEWDVLSLLSTGGGGSSGSGGSGESNTASNIGTAGVGLFKQKTASNLEFKTINAGSNRVSITDDIANNEVDVDVIEANLSITESQINDLGTYEPAFTKNTGFNLNLGSAGGTVSEGSHTHASTDMGSVTVGTNVVALPLPLVMTNVVWNLTHTQNNSAILEHDTTNTERILIKETGLHILAFSISFDADAGEEQISAQIVVDDTTVVPGSFRLASEDDEINDLSNTFTAVLTAGTYVTLQAMANGTGNTLHNSTNFMVTRASGPTGATGPTGAGSNVIVQDGGTPAANTPHSTLNFAGGLTATDAGAGVVNVVAPAKEILSRHNGSITQTFTSLTTLNFGTVFLTDDAAYTHAVVVGGSEITINKASRYELTYDVSFQNGTNNRTSSRTEFQLNGVFIPGTYGRGYHRNNSNGPDTASATLILNLSIGDVIRVRASGTLSLVSLADSCRLNISEI